MTDKYQPASVMKWDAVVWIVFWICAFGTFAYTDGCKSGGRAKMECMEDCQKSLTPDLCVKSCN